MNEDYEDDVGAMPITNKIIISMFGILIGTVLFYAGIIMGIIYLISKL